MPWPLSRWWSAPVRRRDESLGAWGERYAAHRLRCDGLRIVARGYRESMGEIDLIALDQRTIVFIEVKTRVGPDEESPAAAVDSAKQRRLTQLALRYLKREGLLECPCRFDVVAITASHQAAPLYQHFIGAFEALSSDSMFG